MRSAKLIALVATSALISLAANFRTHAEDLAVRVAAYNVRYGSMGTPEAIGGMFKKYDLDVVGFSEVPKGDWTLRCGKVLGMEHAYVGEHSPYQDPNKFKSILSRTPLADTREYHFGDGWSAVAARTTVRGVELSIYSLHTGGRHEGHQSQLARKIFPADKSDNVIMMGDFNSVVGTPREKRNAADMKSLLDAGMRPTWTDLKIDVDKHWTLDTLEPESSLARYGVIDHILIGPKSKLVAMKGSIIELEKPLSDHKPIWAALEIKE
jgi:maltose 6'-phosphate phosphatase